MVLDKSFYTIWSLIGLYQKRLNGQTDENREKKKGEKMERMRGKKRGLESVRLDRGGKRPVQKVLVLVCCVRGPASKDSHRLNPPHRSTRAAQ